MQFSREEKINHVNKSPESVAVHDKERWLSIFSQYAIVEDPVGSRPHVNGIYDKKGKQRGSSALSRFYETFIAPNTIQFNVERDIVCEDHVMRDLSISINMPGTTVSVPMHLLYELTDENNEIKIRRLAAHWELMPMVNSLMSKGGEALPAMMSLSKRMMKYQGVSGIGGFMSGLGKLRSSAKQTVEQFFDAFNGKERDRFNELFTPDALVRAPHGSQAISPFDMFESLDGKLTFKKIIKAGYTITSSISFAPADTSEEKQGVAVFEFDTKAKKISRLTFYFE